MSIYDNRVCKQCGKTFSGGPRAWYCPVCRLERIREQGRICKQKERRGLTREIGSIDYCEICGKEYIVNGGNHRFCSECAEIHLKQVDNEQSAVWNEANAERVKEIKKRRRTHKGKEVACVVCGGTFIGDGTKRNVCSESCEKERIRLAQQRADRKRSRKTSGVCWCEKKKKWRVSISFNGKQINILYVDDKQDAINVRKEAEKNIESGEFIEWLKKIRDDRNQRKKIYSQISGVTYNKNNSRGIKKYPWVASIRFNKKSYYLGAYESQEEAEKVRTEAEKNIKSGTFEEWYEKLKLEQREWGRTKPEAKKKSGVKGVVWFKSYQAWQAQIYRNGKTYYIMLTKDLNEAIELRKLAEENKYHLEEWHKWWIEKGKAEWKEKHIDK